MKNRWNTSLWLILAGLFSVAFFTMMTVSFYGHVLKSIGVEHAENITAYDYHYVMIVDNVDSLFWQDVYASVKEEAAQNQAYVELKGKNQSSNYSITDYMDMSIASKVDGILLEYTGEFNLEKKVKEATDKGIPVVTLLNDSPKTTRSSYVGINSYQLGQEYGNQIMKLLPEEQKETKVTVLLHNNSIDSNQSQIFNQINNLMVTSPQTAGWVDVEEQKILSQGAFASEEMVWNLFQNEDGPPDIIVCMDEVDTEAVYQAMIDYNKVGQMQVIGYYISDSILDAIESGSIAMSLYIDTDQMGRDSVQALTECRKDGRTNSFYSVDLQFVTKDNINDYKDR